MNRVLLIDDDPAALATTAAQLQPLEVETTWLAGGVEALEHLEQSPTELVICDLMMPEVDGHAVARAYKAHSRWRFVPFLLLTALDSDAAIIAGLEAGADEFVSKPIEGAVLRARVRSLLRAAHLYRQSPPVDRSALIAQAALTTREREVLDLLLLGRTHEDIATVLGITERTSRFHQANLFVKLGGESRLDLLRIFA